MQLLASFQSWIFWGDIDQRGNSKWKINGSLHLKHSNGSLHLKHSGRSTCAHVAKKCGIWRTTLLSNVWYQLSLYVLQKTRFFWIFSSGWTGNPDCFALKQIPHIGGHFKTLTFKIGGLEAEIFVWNHKSIPIYNYTGWLRKIMKMLGPQAFF